MNSIHQFSKTGDHATLRSNPWSALFVGIHRVTRLFPALLLCVTVPHLFTSGVSLGSEFSHDQLVVALKPDKDPDAMRTERENLTRVLSEKLGKPVKVIVPLSGAVIIEGLANGTIDIAHVSGGDMLNAEQAKAASLLLAVEIGERTYYQSYWLALKEKPYNDVRQLRGKKVAFASRTSTSGFVVPVFDLKQKGLIEDGRDLEAFFGTGNVWFGSGYVSAVERVLRGEVEAAAVSDYVLNADKHLTQEQRARLKVVAAQGPVPTHVLAVSHRLSTNDREKLSSLFLGLNAPEHHTLRNSVFVSKLVPVDSEKHVGHLRKALEFAKTVRGS